MTLCDTPGEEPLLDLIDLFAQLRRDCAWKAAQTHESLTPFLLEEANEVIEAIGSGEPARICDELGDVLLQVYLHAAIAAEAGMFDINDVAQGLREKMIRRNPHVFGGEPLTDIDAIDAQWKRIKAEERKAAGSKNNTEPSETSNASQIPAPSL